MINRDRNIWATQADARKAGGRSLYLLGASLACIGLSLLNAPFVVAQESDEPAEQAEEGLRYAPVVVSARRAEEGLQDVPIAVTALDDSQLQGQLIANAADFTGVVPNLLATQTGGSVSSAQIFLRGVGQNNLGFNGESPVAVYLDDVYLGRVQGALVELVDFERIEVLRGPQGTLYGRNSTAGAVKYVTRRPDLRESRYVLDARVGDYDTFDFKGSASIPIIEDKVAIKADFVSRDRRGFTDGVDAAGNPTGAYANGVNRQIGRVSLYAEPYDTFRVDLSADYIRDRSGPQVMAPTHCAPGHTDPCPLVFGPYKTGINGPDVGFFDGMGASAKLEWDLGWGTLKSVTSYRTLEDRAPIDISAIPGSGRFINIGNDQKQYAQEVQLSTDILDGRVDIITGVFLFREEAGQDSNFLNLRRNVDDQVTTSVAVFGEGIIALTDTLNLTLGGRLTRDEKDVDRQVFNPYTSAAPNLVASAAFEDTVFTPKVSVDWKPVEPLLLYATYSEGVRAGGFSEPYPGTLIAAQGTFDTEVLKSTEVGAKTSWFGGRLTANLALFDQAFDGLQQNRLTATTLEVVTSDISYQGVELEFDARITDNFRLFGNLGLLDAQVEASNIPGDNLNRRIQYAADHQYRVGGHYSLPVSALGGELFATAVYGWVDDFAQDQANTPNVISPSYDTIDASIGYVTSDNRWRIALDAKNMTDTLYSPTGVGTSGRFYAAPRMVTLNLTFRSE